MFLPKYTLFLISINIFHSLYNSQFFVSLLEICVLISSIFYHYNLIDNFRNYDILITNSVILHHFILYYYHISYEFETILPSIFYILAIISYIYGAICNNDIYHGYLHIFGVIANILSKKYLIYDSFLLFNNEIDTEMKTKTKTEAKMEAKIEKETEAKMEAKMETEKEIKIEAKMETEKETKMAEKMAEKIEKETETKMEKETEIKMEVKMKTETESKMEFSNCEGVKN